jgi:hypothetical protein
LVPPMSALLDLARAAEDYTRTAPEALHRKPANRRLRTLQNQPVRSLCTAGR